MGIPGNFPKEAVGIGEIAGVTAPEDRLSGFDKGSARGHRFLEYLFHFLGRGRVVRQRECTKAAALGRRMRILRQGIPSVEG